jgi:16S rRNA (guanine527-N7)-methyltransferase
LAILARRNSKINLTAFDLDAPTEQALERLVIEPLRATPWIRESSRSLVDIGSGGGSPALPLAILCPQVRLTMVEVRERKAAFLREAVRAIGVNGVVAARRFEDVAAEWPPKSVDVVSCRAVRPDAGLWEGIDRLLAPAGRVLWFGVGHTTEQKFARLASIDGDGVTVFERPA